MSDIGQHIYKIMKDGATLDASDLFLCSEQKPHARVHGKVEVFNDEPIYTKEMLFEYLTMVLSPKEVDTFKTEQEINAAVAIPGFFRFRLNAFWHLNGISIVLRYIPTDIPVFDELGLPECIKKCAHYKNGLVLITGSTGSGKSTTLACLIDMINREYNKHIITVEDPIEFVHQNRKSLIEQREVGEHTHSFGNALSSTLREAADVILLGEMRTLETISMAITAAETGSLVFATAHTNGAVDTINRLVDVFPAGQQNQIRQQLAASLRAVVWQTLVPKKEGKGRVATFETLFKNYAVSSMIRDEKTHQIKSIMQMGLKDGMFTMERYLYELVLSEKISMESAIECIPENSEDFKALFDEKS